MFKKYGIVLILAVSLVYSCSPGDQKEKEMEKTKTEIMEMDSISTVLDSLKNDIRSSSEELDALLNDLN